MTIRNVVARVRPIESVSTTPSVFIPAYGRAYNSVGSSISTVAGSRFPAWQHPDAADSQFNVVWDEEELRLKGWNTYKVDLLHSNPNAGTGNVTIDSTSSVRAVGADLSAGDVSLLTGSIVAAGAQHILASAVVSASLTVTASALRHVRTMRHGADAGDTLVGPWNVLGYRLTKVT